VRLSFLNWLLPELHARGWRTELLNLGGDDMLFLAARDEGATRLAPPSQPAVPLTGARASGLARDPQATHAQQPAVSR
jgi:hypothetical protein